MFGKDARQHDLKRQYDLDFEDETITYTEAGILSFERG